MLTADAASKHGHEFSDPQSARRPVPRRSPFRVLPYAARQRLPLRSKSVRVAMGELKEEPEEAEGSEKDATLNEPPELKMPGSYHDEPPSPDSPIFPILGITEPTTPCDPLPTPANEESATSRPATPPPSKRTHRPRTQYRLAHPPPSKLPLRRQGILRPRVLLQFQQQSLSGFHRPMFEVVPLSRFDTATKMGQKLRRLEKGKHNLTAEDLVVMKVEDYSTADSFSDHVEDSDSRDVLGVISSLQKQDQTRPGSVQILLENSLWEGTPGKDGIFDLILHGENPQFARWYIPKSKRRPTQVDGLDCPAEERKFYFTAILPNSKKHPTIASMSEGHLDIYDNYTVTSDMPSDVPWLPATSPAHDDESCVDVNGLKETPKAPEAIPTDDLLRKLIIVSSSWVVFCESWSPHFRYAPSRDPSPTYRPSMRPPGLNCRSSSLPIPSSGFDHSRSESPSDRAQSVPNDNATGIARSTHSTPLNSLPSSQRPSPPPTPSEPEIRPILLKRSTFSGFSLRRASSTGRRKGSFNPRSPSLQLTPALASPHSAVAVEQSTSAEEIPLSPQVEPTDAISDPTAQFRHVASLEKSDDTQSPCPAPRSKIDGLIRRTSHISSSPSVGNRRSRRHSIHWNWHSPLEQLPKLRDRMPSRSRSKSVVISEPDHAMLTVHGSTTDDTSVISSNLKSVRTEGTTLAGGSPPGVEDTLSPLSSNHAIDATVMASGENSVQALSETDIVVDQAEEHIDTAPFVEPTILRPPPNATPEKETESPRHPAMDEPPSSSGSESDAIGGPYWRDFDRIQSRAFHERARQLQSQPRPAVDAASTSDERGYWTSDDTHPIEGATQGQTGWLSGLRRSVSRRRRAT
jgi:hypothetical protein